MSVPVVVGLLDSGVDPSLIDADWPRRSFVIADDGSLAIRVDGAPDRVGHGTELARIILHGAPGVRLAVARIFIDRFACTPAAAAAGLDWLVDQGVRLVNMSFGLVHDRAVLREACARATAAGVLLAAAAPARGRSVFPGSYDGVVRVSGDARCRPGEISVLGGSQADFGACVGPRGKDGGHRRTGGASFATAHFAAVAAARLANNPDAENRWVLQRLARNSRYHGPERRRAEA